MYYCECEIITVKCLPTITVVPCQFTTVRVRYSWVAMTQKYKKLFLNVFDVYIAKPSE